MDTRPLGEIGKADRTISAGDAHRAVADLEIAGAGFQRFGSDLPQILAELACGTLDADAACRNRRRAAGAKTGRDQIGIALHDVDALGRQPELLGDELRVSPLMTLPPRLAPVQHPDVPLL